MSDNGGLGFHSSFPDFSGFAQTWQINCVCVCVCVCVRKEDRNSFRKSDNQSWLNASLGQMFLAEICYSRL